jgi:hypothetical protein
VKPVADFNPPDSHWAADFDARLVGSLTHLLERVERLEALVRELHGKDKWRDDVLHQTVSDIRYWAEKKDKQP